MDVHSDALEPVSKASAVDAVADQLRARILSGALSAGARLPSERELATQLRVNRLTLRAALSRLEALGLIATQHGIGSVVRDFRQHGGIESLPRLLAVMHQRDARVYVQYVKDALELRRTIAIEAVALAAERHDESDLATLRTLAEAQRARTKDLFDFARGDVEFARSVVRAGRNLALELLLNTVARFPDEDPTLTRAMYLRPVAQQKLYAPLISLIADRDVELARGTMRATLTRLDEQSTQWVERAVLGAARTRIAKPQPVAPKAPDATSTPETQSTARARRSRTEKP